MSKKFHKNPEMATALSHRPTLLTLQLVMPLKEGKPIKGLLPSYLCRHVPMACTVQAPWSCTLSAKQPQRCILAADAPRHLAASQGQTIIQTQTALPCRAPTDLVQSFLS